MSHLAHIGRGQEPTTETDLYARYFPEAYTFLMRLTRDPMQAEDLAQECLLIVLQRVRLNRLYSLGSLHAYIRRVCRMLWLGMLRRSEQSRMIYIEPSEIENQIDGLANNGAMPAVRSHCPDNEMHRKTAAMSVFSNLRMDRDRDLLIRYVIYEQSKMQICAELELSPPHFDRVLSRARSRLKKEINKNHGCTPFEYISNLLFD